jgi:hypothetical protein
VSGQTSKKLKRIRSNNLIKGALQADEPKPEQFFSKKIEYPFRRSIASYSPK